MSIAERRPACGDVSVIYMTLAEVQTHEREETLYLFNQMFDDLLAVLIDELPGVLQGLSLLLRQLGARGNTAQGRSYCLNECLDYMHLSKKTCENCVYRMTDLERRCAFITAEGSNIIRASKASLQCSNINKYIFLDILLWIRT